MKPKSLALIFAVLVVPSIIAEPISTRTPAYDELKSKRARPGPYEYEYVPGERSSEVQGPFYFPQTINHNMREKPPRVFDQRYWVNDQYYRKGRPVFLIIANAKDAKDELSLLEPQSIFNRMAKDNEGMLVILEHRYFGKSFPVRDLSEANLEFLTIRHVLADLRNFAWVGMNNKALQAGREEKRVPWILIGGGYAGGLVHWAMMKYPEIFYAGYSSSGMVQAKTDFWQYWIDVARMMPTVCAKDIAAVITYFDFTVDEGNPLAISAMKAMLGLPQINNLDDVAEILSIDLATWADVDNLIRPDESKNIRIYQLCDALKLKNHRDYGEDRVFATFKAWKEWNRENYNAADVIWNTHDRHKAEYTNIEVSPNSERSFKWIQCNELGWFQTAPPRNKVSDPIIVSEHLSYRHELRICKNYFPRRYREPDSHPDAEYTNEYFGGWNKGPAKRVFYLVGGNNPYRGVTFLARDDGLKPNATLAYIDEGHYLTDFRAIAGDPEVDRHQKRGLIAIEGWVKEFYNRYR